MVYHRENHAHILGAVAPNAARNFAHLYAVSGRQHSMGAVAKMQIESKRTMVGNETGITKSYR